MSTSEFKVNITVNPTVLKLIRPVWWVQAKLGMKSVWVPDALFKVE